MPSPTEMMLQVEPFVKTTARKFASKICPVPDMEQELRLALFMAIDGFDESMGASWKTYATQIIRFRAIDIIRRLGHRNRKGTQHKMEWGYSIDVRDDAGRKVIDEPEDHDNGLLDVEWGDLEEQIQKEDTHAKAWFYCLQGLTKKQVGDRLGLSESRISQLTTDPRGLHIIQQLIDHPFKKGTSNMNHSISGTVGSPSQNGEMSSMTVVQAIQVLADPASIKTIDAEIERLSQQLAQMKRLRKQITSMSAPSSSSRRRSTRSGSSETPLDTDLDLQIVAAVKDGTNRIKEIAEKIGKPWQRVALHIKKSPSLVKQDDGTVAAA